MDTEFHYWLTGLIAYRAGFTRDEALTIAHSSQYVDENDVTLEIGGADSTYRNFVSQTMNILKPRDELRRIYPIFHFIPGEPDAVTARRRDGKMHLLNTTPNNEKANILLDAAFKSSEETRLYRIGIATHAYVDTWAHQNFVGWFDGFNAIGIDLKPNIGHADAEHQPDIISYRWMDHRLVDGEVNNKHRCLSAARSLFRKYCEFLEDQGRLGRGSRWARLRKELDAIQGPTYTGPTRRREDQRRRSYGDCLPWFPDFDDRQWFDAAIETKVKGGRDTHRGILAKFTIFRDEYAWRPDKEREETDWYRFQEAVKAHERIGIRLLKGTFAKMGVDIRAV